MVTKVVCLTGSSSLSRGRTPAALFANEIAVNPVNLRPDLGGSGEHNMTELVEGFDAGIDRRAACDHQHPDRFDIAISRFR